jgi:hypothetical protein
LKGVFEVTGGGTQNLKGLHSFADITMISNNILKKV